MIHWIDKVNPNFSYRLSPFIILIFQNTFFPVHMMVYFACLLGDRCPKHVDWFYTRSDPWGGFSPAYRQLSTFRKEERMIWVHQWMPCNTRLLNVNTTKLFIWTEGTLEIITESVCHTGDRKSSLRTNTATHVSPPSISCKSPLISHMPTLWMTATHHLLVHPCLASKPPRWQQLITISLLTLHANLLPTSAHLPIDVRGEGSGWGRGKCAPVIPCLPPQSWWMFCCIDNVLHLPSGISVLLLIVQCKFP